LALEVFSDLVEKGRVELTEAAQWSSCGLIEVGTLTADFIEGQQAPARLQRLRGRTTCRCKACDRLFLDKPKATCFAKAHTTGRRMAGTTMPTGAAALVT
jgi:hypothetical protein